MDSVRAWIAAGRLVPTDVFLEDGQSWRPLRDLPREPGPAPRSAAPVVQPVREPSVPPVTAPLPRVSVPLPPEPSPEPSPVLPAVPAGGMREAAAAETVKLPAARVPLPEEPMSFPADGGDVFDSLAGTEKYPRVEEPDLWGGDQVGFRQRRKEILHRAIPFGLAVVLGLVAIVGLWILLRESGIPEVPRTSPPVAQAPAQAPGPAQAPALAQAPASATDAGTSPAPVVTPPEIPAAVVAVPAPAGSPAPVAAAVPVVAPSPQIGRAHG